MLDYIFFMHGDANDDGADWDRYLAKLRATGQFQGGSSIGAGECVSRSRTPKPTTAHLTGYIRVQANSLEEAKALLDGNPVFEAGGTVEIRELPRG